MATLDGRYTPQVDEVWSSPASQADADQKQLDLTAQILQLREQLSDAQNSK